MRFYNDDGPRVRRRMSFGPGAISPFIKWMLIINVGVLILQYVWRGQLEPVLGLTPALFFSDFPNYLYTIVTYMFLHSTYSIFHILFNMFILWMFGTEIEYTWGSKRFARFYILAGIAGAILTLIVYSGQAVPMIGASGAIYGLLIAYWFMFPNRHLYIYFLFPVKVKWAIPAMMLLGFFLGGQNVAHMAHLGGALFGIAFMKTDWRFASLTSKIKSLRYKRKEAKLEKRRQAAEDVMKKVDAILDKINQVGFENLTKAERKFLEEASDELAKQKDKQQ
ncbi:rhomboid family intramembrane serine protease [candidate division GN15 bacterium]|nr:rhomboid family intramembrane serine protease [candidate division GN15 bacterium]